MSQYEIRELRESDKEQVLDVAETFVLESPIYAEFGCDREWTWQTIKRCSDQANEISLVAIQDDKIVGFLCGHLGYYTFMNKFIATEYAWYILPEYRKGMIGVALLKAYIRWAKDNGAIEVCVNPTTQIQPERTGRLLGALGFKSLGTINKKRIN